MSTRPALGLARFACGLLLPAMREDLRWSLAEAGALNTANELGYLLGAAVPASAAEAGFPVLASAAAAGSRAPGGRRRACPCAAAVASPAGVVRRR
nr:YbfB/YjiJ family MFS transporter [Nonomuraea maritima]